MASGSHQLSFDQYDLSSDDEECLTPTNVAETTPGQTDHAAHLLTAARLYLNSPPEAPKNWGQTNPYLNDYNSDSMEISSTFWIPDITDWWRQQEQTHSKYTNLSNVARDIFPIIPHDVTAESSFSLGLDVISRRHSKTTGDTLGEEVVVRQFPKGNNGILAGHEKESDTSNTENDSEMKKEAEESKLHRMAKVHNLLEMWQGSHNLSATQKESCAQNKQMTAVGYISNTEEIVKASWSLFQHDGAAAFKLTERSPFPPALSANDLPGGWTKLINIRRIRRINLHPVDIDEDSTPESFSDTEDWLNWNANLDNPNDTQDDCSADFESDIEHGNGIKDPECPEQQDASTAPNVFGLIWETRKSNRQAENVFVTVNAIETRRHKGVKKKLDRMCQLLYVAWPSVPVRDIFAQTVSSSLWIPFDKWMYSRQNEAFDRIYIFWSCESEQCKKVTALGFTKVNSLYLTERQPISSNHDENSCWWQHILDGQ